jgi:hypothetical protein
LTLIRFPGRWRGSPDSASSTSQSSSLNSGQQPVQAIYEFHASGWRECDARADVNGRLYAGNVGALIYTLGSDPRSPHSYHNGTAIKLSTDEFVGVGLADTGIVDNPWIADGVVLVSFGHGGLL